MLDSDEIIARASTRLAAKYARVETDDALFRRGQNVPQGYLVLSRTLQNRLEQFAETEEAQLSLRRELSLHRASAQDAIDAYGKALDFRAMMVEGGVTDAAMLKRADEAVAIAADAMRDVLKEVQGCAVDAARVEAVSKGNFTLSGVRSILSQVGRLMYDICGEEYAHLAVELERRIMTDIKVAVIEGGTSLTPDMDVREMDSMVPFVNPK